MRADDEVPMGLRVAAAYGWRLLVLVAAGFVLVRAVDALEPVAVALFVALIITALVGPMVTFLERRVPRGFAVLLCLLAVFAVVLGIPTFVASQVAGQWRSLVAQFRDGLDQILQWLEQGPLNLTSDVLSDWVASARAWITANEGDLASRALGASGTVLEGFTAFALAIFASIFFLLSGRQIWNWMVNLFPTSGRPRIDGAGVVAWSAFAGYTRGIVAVASINAVLVLLGLLILRVPLALPIALLVFLFSFIPLIGAPLATAIAAIIALATRGPLIALLVLLLIVLIGQLEGHVLQPLVMSRAVNLHPLAVALSVACGTLLAGIVGAVVAVPLVAVTYRCIDYWAKTSPDAQTSDSAEDEASTGPAAAEPS